jgi:hypothetical protein
MLTSDEVEKIVIDVMTNQSPRVTGKEADDFRIRFATDVALAKKNGWSIELPFEIPDIST